MEEVAFGLPWGVTGDVTVNWSDAGKSPPRGGTEERPAVTGYMKGNREYNV